MLLHALLASEESLSLNKYTSKPEKSAFMNCYWKPSATFPMKPPIFSCYAELSRFIQEIFQFLFAFFASNQGLICHSKIPKKSAK